jgi:cytochrome c553
MYRSRSLQGATPQFPRAILFGPGSADEDATVATNRLFMAFNGDPTEAEYQSLEMIQFRGATGRFEFSKVVFSPPSRPLFLKSPPECVRCHDSPGHPNWTPYPFWPGAFPSTDGFSQSGAQEEALYQSFYTQQGGHGRYQYLKLQTPAELESSGSEPDGVVTRRFSNILQSTLRLSLPTLVRSTRNYKSYSWLLSAALNSCDHLEDFVPQKLQSMFAHSYADILAQTTEQEQKSFDARLIDALTLEGHDSPNASGYESDNFSTADVSYAAALRYVLERDGSSIGSFFYNLDPTQWADMRSDLPYVASSVNDHAGASCDDLKTQSLAALTSLLKSAKPGSENEVLSTGLKDSMIQGDRNASAALSTSQTVSSAQAIIQSSCIRCHSNGTQAPLLHFEDLSLFAAQLNGPTHGVLSVKSTLREELIDRVQTTGDRRMPPETTLSSGEIQNLIDFVNTLK